MLRLHFALLLQYLDILSEIRGNFVYIIRIQGFPEAVGNNHRRNSLTHLKHIYFGKHLKTNDYKNQNALHTQSFIL